MGRENKKAAVAALHRQQILSAAEKLFTEKGFEQTTIGEISEASAYSRRTIYAYYTSKEDILHHIVAEGLHRLKEDLTAVLNRDGSFENRFLEICRAMQRYQYQCPQSAGQVMQGKTAALPNNAEQMTPALRQILQLGSEINGMLKEFLKEGKQKGDVRSDVTEEPSVYILWSSISGLLALTQTKGTFLTESLAMTEEQFLEYGFRQILHSIREVKP